MAHKVTLNWDVDPGATSYNVKRATSAGGPFATIASPTTNSYVDNSPEVQQEGAKFFYDVTGVNSAGESGPSLVVSVTVPFSVPPVPTGLVATAA